MFNCSVVSPLAPGAGWVYSFPGSSSSPGDYTATVALTQPDSNPANDADDAPITLFAVKDVAVNITAAPGSALVGSSFNFTVNM